MTANLHPTMSGRQDELRWRAAHRQLSVMSGLWLARFHSRRGRPASAEAIHRRLLLRYPDELRVLADLGGLLMRRRSFEDALDVWQRVAALRPNSSGSIFQVSRAFHRLGRLQEAAERYLETLSVDPAHSKAVAALEEIALRILCRQPSTEADKAAAIDIARRLLALPGEAPRAAAAGIVRIPVIEAGMLMLDAPEIALAEFNIALGLVPDLPEALRGAAMCFELLGEFGKAVATLDELIRVEPRATEPRLQRERMFAQLEGRTRSANQDDELTEEVRVSWLARAQHLLGKPELTPVIDLDPAQHEAALGQARLLLQGVGGDPDRLLGAQGREGILARARGLLERNGIGLDMSTFDPARHEAVLNQARALLGKGGGGLDASPLDPERYAAVLSQARALLERSGAGLDGAPLDPAQYEAVLSQARALLERSGGGLDASLLDPAQHEAALSQARLLLQGSGGDLARPLDAQGREKILARARGLLGRDGDGRNASAELTQRENALIRARRLLDGDGADPATPKTKAAEAAEIEELLRSAREAYRNGQLDQAETLCRDILSRRSSHIWALTSLSRILMRQRRFADAIDALTRLHDLQPESADAKTMLGQALFQEGQLEAAAQIYGQLSMLEPENANVWLSLGRIHRRLQNWASARDAWSRLLEVSPERIDARLELATSCQQCGDVGRAVAELQLILQREPDHRRALTALGRLLAASDQEAALPLWSRLAELDPDSIEPIIQSARIHMRQGRFEEAEAGFRRVVERDPGHNEALPALARVVSLRDVGEGVALLKLWSAREPENISPWIEMARVHAQAKRTEEAEAAYQRVLELEPSNQAGLTGLGRLYVSAGWHDKALDVWSAIAELVPSSVESKLQTARILHVRRDPQVEEILHSLLKIDPENREGLQRLAQFKGRQRGGLDAALELWERLVVLDPQLVVAIVQRGRLLERARRLDEAETEYLRAVARDGRNPLALASLSNFYRLSGRWEEALKVYQAHLEIQPEQTDAILGLGICFDRLNRFKEAQDLYDKALIREPDNATIMAYRGRMSRARGQVDASIADFRRVCELRPDSAEAWQELIFYLAGAEREEEALAALRDAEAVLGDAPSALTVLGRAAASALFHDRAVSYFERAIAAEPQNAAHRAQLGMYYFRQGIIDGAFHHLLDSRELHPLDSRQLSAGDIEVGRALFDTTRILMELGYDPMALRHMPRTAGDILAPERLFGLVRQVAETSVTPYEPVPRRVVAISSTLAPGGAERQLVTMLSGLSEPTFQLDLSLFCTSLAPRYRRDFFLPVLDGTSIDIVVLNFDAVTDYITEPEVAPFAPIIRHFPPDMVAPIAFWLREFRRRQPEVVHAWQDSTNLMAVVAALLAGVPRIILCCRSVRPDNPRRRLRRFMKDAYQAVLSHPSVVMSNNSRAGANDYADWLGIDPARVDVVYNGIDFDRLDSNAKAEETERSRRELGIPEGAPILGGVYRMSEEKRPLLWLDVAAVVARQNPDVHFVICGDGPMRDEMIKYAAGLGIGGRVHMPGAQSNIGSWFKMMDVVMLTSRHEGLPNVLLEAQSLGVPVVAPDVGGMSEVVEQGVTGWTIRNADAAKLAERVLFCLTDRAWRATAVAQAPSFVRERFGIQSMLRRNLEVYGIEA